jgi:superfamily I DNA/RNA helicase/RecB family exonuclease
VVMTGPDFKLVRSARPAPEAPILDPAQRQVLAHERGVLRVLAGPGTGKTTTLVETVVDRVTRRRVPVENVLLLTFSRLAAGELRDRVTARLQRTISEPVARTFHSYAFGLVRRAAVLAGDPTPRLLSGSEQDVTLRELLAGRLADRSDDWPPELGAAVHTRAFSDELRELLMRAVERDVSPDELIALGHRRHRADWIVGAEVLREYLEVTALKAPGAFDAAELIQRANAELRRSPELLLSERIARRRIFVDEYQDTDPAQIELLKLIATGADELVLIGDPDQSIYAFRGADRYAMAEIDEQFGDGLFVPTVSLSVCRRSGPTLLDATRRVAARLSGPAQHRQLTASPDAPGGDLRVELFATSSQEAAQVASVLRRHHLEDGVPWSEMAVLVRSLGPTADTLRRGLAAAGVPVIGSVQSALSDEPLVSQLLTLLRCVAKPESVTTDDAESLLVGPIGRADPLQVVRMRRYLRRAAGGPVTLAALVTEAAAVSLVAPAVRRPIERVRAAVEAGDRAVGGSAEDVLWQVWQATGLSHRLYQRSLAGGSDGARADRDLDAMLALFAEAAKVSDRTPGGGVAQLYEWIEQLQINDASTERHGPSGEAVAILTAHASKGLEWDVVCLAGVQEGVWPNLRQRGSLLGAEVLVDVVAGRGEQSYGLVAERLVEERRLFYVAATRARRTLLVTAVSDDETQPSRFLDELDPLPAAVVDREVSRAPRRFVLTGIVAELRAVVVDPAADEADRNAAAIELARLAEARVPGADPEEWWGLADATTDAPIRRPESGPVPIRPSKFEAYTDCELRALLSDLGATDATDEVAASLGTLVHWVAEQAAPNATVADLTELLEQGWSRLEFTAPWHGVSERARAQRMLVALAKWLSDSRTGLTLVAVEKPFKVEIGDAVVSGKVDRLEQDDNGRLVVIDLKTGKNKPTNADVLNHPQLAVYQLAVTEGAFTDGDAADPGGARLVQLGAATPGQQPQPPLTDLPEPGWVRAELDRIAAVLRGNTVTARPGAACTRCLVRASCPAQLDGRQVTQ